MRPDPDVNTTQDGRLNNQEIYIDVLIFEILGKNNHSIQIQYIEDEFSKKKKVKRMMKNSLKGALLSGLIFPGLGQMVLKRYKRGVVLMLTVLSSLCVIIVISIQIALSIIENIGSKGEMVDIWTISNAATRASTSSDSLIINFFILLVILCWIIGVVDAYKIGKEKDLEKQPTRHVSSSTLDYS